MVLVSEDKTLLVRSLSKAIDWTDQRISRPDANTTEVGRHMVERQRMVEMRKRLGSMDGEVIR